MSRNVYVIDAADLDETNGSVVPTDLAQDNADVAIEDDSFALTPAKWKHEWAVKIINDCDQAVDATPVVSTDDDLTMTSYTTVDALNTNVGTGTPPDNVELLSSDTVAGAIGVLLNPAAAATGTVTVVFQKRRTG